MNFSLSDEQTMLQDSVNKFVQNDYSYELRQKLIQTELGYSEENWQTFAELGWLCVPFSEEDGGIGGGPIETMIMMEAFGKGLVVEPYFSTVVLGGSALRIAGNSEQKASLIPEVVEGRRLVSVAYAEPQSRYNLFDVKTEAKKGQGGYVLNGQKSFVLHGASADTLVVSARTGGEQMDKSGISLFLVDPKLGGVDIKGYKSLDGHRVAEVVLKNVEVSEGSLLGVENDGLAVLEAIADESMLALCAEAVGIMENLYKDTVEYTKNRKQFNVPISSFQALQHRMVDMFTEHEQCKSLLLRAVLSYQDGDADARKNIAALKYQVGVSGQKVAHEAIQIHGGMGMTDEMNVGMNLKRINVINTLFGGSDYQLARFIELS